MKSSNISTKDLRVYLVKVYYKIVFLEIAQLSPETLQEKEYLLYFLRKTEFIRVLTTFLEDLDR